MGDERWEMGDGRWEMRDERWEMRGAAFVLFSFVAFLLKKPLSAIRLPFTVRHIR